MTNMGILDAAQMVLGDLRPQDAFMCGSIKYKPHFQLAISSYDGELTLSVNLLGSADDRDCILSFLAEIDAELSCWESSQRALPRTEMHPLRPSANKRCPSTSQGFCKGKPTRKSTCLK